MKLGDSRIMRINMLKITVIAITTGLSVDKGA